MKNSIGLKLSTSFIIVILLMGYSSIFGLIQSNKIQNEYEFSINVADKMLADMLTVRGEEILQQNRLNNYIFSNDVSAKDWIVSSIAKNDEIINSMESALTSIPASIRPQYVEKIDAVKEIRARWLPYVNETFSLMEGGATIDQIDLRVGKEGGSFSKDFSSAADKLLGFLSEQQAVNIAKIRDTKTTDNKMQYMLLGAVIILTSIIAIILI